MTTGEQLLAEGEPIVLTNGQKVHLRYPMTAILWLSRKGFWGEPKTAEAAELSDVEKTLGLMAGGLMHEHDEKGAPLTIDRLAELVDYRDWEELEERVQAAVREAMPPKQRAALDKAMEEAQTSPGQSGTTSPPSSSGEPTNSSGE